MRDICLPAGRKAARGFILVVFVTIAIAALFVGGLAPLHADGDKLPPQPHYMPVIANPDSSPTINNDDALPLINRLRVEAGIAPVGESGKLTNNCFEHARYMVENNILSHDQDPNLPYATDGGATCARNANAWLGSNNTDPGWTPKDSVDGWMNSVAHRLWLIYPTTETVGFGFFSKEQGGRAAAALDILSHADFSADESYSDWPVRYPQGSNIPSTQYPITLNWRYFGSKPVLKSSQLQTANGRILAHAANTNLPAGHKGIQLIPNKNLPANTEIQVTVTGTYDGNPFTYTWGFRTASSTADHKSSQITVINQ